MPQNKRYFDNPIETETFETRTKPEWGRERRVTGRYRHEPVHLGQGGYVFLFRKRPPGEKINGKFTASQPANGKPTSQVSQNVKLLENIVRCRAAPSNYSSD